MLCSAPPSGSSSTGWPSRYPSPAAGCPRRSPRARSRRRCPPHRRPRAGSPAPATWPRRRATSGWRRSRPPRRSRLRRCGRSPEIARPPKEWQSSGSSSSVGWPLASHLTGTAPLSPTEVPLSLRSLTWTSSPSSRGWSRRTVQSVSAAFTDGERARPPRGSRPAMEERSRKRISPWSGRNAQPDMGRTTHSRTEPSRTTTRRGRRGSGGRTARRRARTGSRARRRRCGGCAGPRRSRRRCPRR